MDSLPGSSLGIPAGFQEIDPNELTWEEVIGRGAFGMVSRGGWRGIEVAVKYIETDSEQKAFKTELKQLSRVDHPNIVKLFGACTRDTVCLVMEYAEGGSLYNVLHGTGVKPDYTLAHSMSWVIQCAKGVEYLHGMKPKPLIHRDLKPPNLLLMLGGTVLKICDFGTACDAHTYMTNNKGSAAWMAPEVFEGNKYSEKCDVFSWGIILWEVLSRRKPFSEIGGHAFRIMWAVHSGTRPPLIANCPKPMENLMVRCWSSNPVIRPSMAEVVNITSKFSQLLDGADLPLIYPTPEGAEVLTPQAEQLSSVYDTPPMSTHSQRTGDMSKVATIRENFRQGTDGEPVPLQPPVVPRRRPVVVEEEIADWRGTSAPASLAASRESLLELKSSRSSTPIAEMANKRFSADLSKITHADIMNVDIGDAANKPRAPPRGHRRTGSHGTPVVNTTPTNQYPAGREVRCHRRTGSHGTPYVCSPTHNLYPFTTPVQGHRRTGSFGNTPVTTAAPETEFQHAVSLVHVTTAPGNLNDVGDNIHGGPLRSMSWTQGMAGTALTMDPALIKAILSMDHQLQPLAPCKGNKESLLIFENHCRMAQEYLRAQSEIAHLNKCKKELMEDLAREDNKQQILEYRQLVNENEDLSLLHNNLKKQVQNMKKDGHNSRISAPP